MYFISILILSSWNSFWVNNSLQLVHHHMRLTPVTPNTDCMSGIRASTGRASTGRILGIIAATQNSTSSANTRMNNQMFAWHEPQLIHGIKKVMGLTCNCFYITIPWFTALQFINCRLMPREVSNLNYYCGCSFKQNGNQASKHYVSFQTKNILTINLWFDWCFVSSSKYTWSFIYNVDSFKDISTIIEPYSLVINIWHVSMAWTTTYPWI